MKKLILALVPALMTFAAGVAEADTICGTTKGDTITLGKHPVRGDYATLVSKAATDYYKQSMRVTIEKFETIVDPESNKYMKEEDGEDAIYAMRASGREVGNMWGLYLYKKQGQIVDAKLIDTNGHEIDFKPLTCKTVPSFR